MTTTTTTTATKKGSSKSRMMVVLALVALIFSLLYLGLGRSVPVVDIANGQLHSRVNWNFHSREVEVYHTNDLDEAIQKHHQAEVEKAHYDNAINNNAPVCGFPFKHNDDWSQVTIDVSACKGGEHFPIRFGNVYVPQRWEAKAYFYGHGQPKEELEKFVGKELVNPVEVDWRVLHEDSPDGFSSVTTVGTYLHERKGDTKIVYGKGDLIALTRQ